MKIRGMNELRRNISNFSRELNEVLPTALKAGALIVQNEAKRRAPYETGTLRRSIHTEMRGNTQAFVGTDVEYAVHQEFGTSKMKAHPYLRPALDEKQQEVLEKINTIVKAEVFKE